MRVGISYVSPANAQANLDAENPAGDDLRHGARQRAHRRLEHASSAASTSAAARTAQQQTFYTALYHALLHPNVFSDVNGQYTGMDQQVHAVARAQHAQYANFSGWDVYRGQVQLVTLLAPGRRRGHRPVAAQPGQPERRRLGPLDPQPGRHPRDDRRPGARRACRASTRSAAPTSTRAGALTSMVHAATTVTAADLSRDGWNVMVVGERPSLDK